MSEKIAALDAGANDYMTKPFGAGELFARIRVWLRPVPARQRRLSKLRPRGRRPSDRLRQNALFSWANAK